MRDAALVQLNGAHMGDELTWEPLAAAHRRGPAADDQDVRDKILAVLRVGAAPGRGAVRDRRPDRHSVFQPTREDPAVVVMIDEVDEIAQHPRAPARSWSSWPPSSASPRSS